MDSRSSILVVDDDNDIRCLVRQYLDEHGYHAIAAANGAEMWSALDAQRVDLLLLDLMLPGEHGLALCRKLRSRSTIPVIVLSALSDETERVAGLELGADDYVSKPFSPGELLARIRSVLRRSNTLPRNLSLDDATCIRFAGWILDTRERHAISPKKSVVALSGAEYYLLRVFLKFPNRVLTRDQLLDLSKRREMGPSDRSIDVQISRLRQRLEEDARRPTIIKTVRSEGYVLAAEVRIDG